MKKKRLFLIDGPAIFYRAYFAFIRNPLINSKGENTSAAFGYVNSIMKIMREESPDFMGVAFDTKAPTFRHKMYDEYKSTRAKMPDDLVEQLPRIKEATKALGLPGLEIEGYEADDIIGTLAKKAESDNLEVWIVSGDKDMFQLVNDNVRIYNPGKGSSQAEKFDSDGVEKKLGVPPNKIIDMLALMGDSSDNIPGVPGIGPKTAVKLLEEFDSLEDILENTGKISAKGTRKKIEDNLDKARLSKKLVTIDTDVPIRCSYDDLKQGDIDFEASKEFFLEMEFSTFLRELAEMTGQENLAEAAESYKKNDEIVVEYSCIDNEGALEILVNDLLKKKEVAVDTETDSLDSLKANLVGISLCAEAGKAYYIPIAHDQVERNIPLDKARPLLKRLFENKKVQKFGQNVKYDLEVLHRAGFDLEPIGFDTMLASYVLSPSGRQHGLNSLALEHLNYTMQSITELIGTGKKQKSFAVVDVDKAVFYAAEDADYTYRLRGVLAPKLDEFKLVNLYYNIELPLIKILASMEEEGVRVDSDYLREISKELDLQLEKTTRDIYTEAGHEFNINSTQQLSIVLFEELNLPTKGKTAKKTGYSTDVRVLEELAQIHDLPRMILEYRQLLKLKNTYVDAIPKLINDETGRVHTSFNQTIAATGRLSSTDPNLQNIPVRTEIGRRIRKAFIPRDDDHKLLVADYSQVELRILAHISGDEKLIEAFKDREDIHARTAAEVYGISINDVTPEMRRSAKTANFAVIYGVSAYGLSQQTDMDVAQSKEFINTYFERYPGIKKYMDDTIALAREKGYVTTMFNRIRYLPEINAKNRNVRQFAERTAINTPIQGTAADMIKVAMIKIYDRIKDMKSKMILQVHDELIFDVHNDEISELKNIVRDGMEKAVKLDVPVVADIGTGDNWLDAK